MKTKKLGAVALLAAALVMPLGACANSGDSGGGNQATEQQKLSKDEACSQTKDAFTELTNQAAPTSPEGLANTVKDFNTKLGEIAAKSPDDIKSALDKAIAALQKAADDPANAQSSDFNAAGAALGVACPNLGPSPSSSN